ncbi:MAG: hypothetical protein JJU15_06825 [Pararhodobacter sp.]|nr:hypothetical protein [Pararhodobacter sp.]
MEALRVYIFAPAWGLPSSGPFALKLLAWLSHAGIPYQAVVENRPNRGPQGKSPWITEGAQTLGDSDAIISHLALKHGMPDPTRIYTAEDACRDAMKLAFEERFHQILEWELFLHPEGFDGMQRYISALAPPVIGGLILRQMRRHFRHQLRARGVGRHAPEQIAAMGRRQLDALALCLDKGGGWLGKDGPALADFACWGQVAPLLAWPMATPVASHAKSLPALENWHQAIMHRCFGGMTPPQRQATGAMTIPA